MSLGMHHFWMKQVLCRAGMQLLMSRGAHGADNHRCPSRTWGALPAAAGFSG